tara:strand:- start:371 stop:493 length:123 start_codon:yes stop_codon:yes gene_type:complete
MGCKHTDLGKGYDNQGNKSDELVYCFGCETQYYVEDLEDV